MHIFDCNRVKMNAARRQREHGNFPRYREHGIVSASVQYWLLISQDIYNNINFFFNLSRLKAALKSFDVYNLRIAKYFFFDRCFSDIPLFCEISTSNIKNDKYMDLLCKFQILVNSLKMALLRDIVNYFLKAKKTETLPRLKICFCQYCDCNKMSNCHCWHEQLGDFCC